VIDPSGRVSFDRAAEYYDQTRALPSAALEGVVDRLVAELEGRGRCLEIGVGTGRIALPLAGAGIPMAGIDVSSSMVGRLVAKAGGYPPFPVALADATRLPFRDHLFGAALSVHVFHLIPRWEAAVDEVLRVVRPGGVVLVDLGGPEDDPVVSSVEERFGAAAGFDARKRPGVTRDTTPDLDARFASAGCALRFLEPVPVTWEWTLAELVDRLGDGIYSWTWGVDEAARRRAADEVRAWAASEYGPLDALREQHGEIRYRAYDLPDRANP
jgi:SAM-dependent methyltransferase